MSYDKIDWSKHNITSCQPCGCDPGANWKCEWHRAEEEREVAEAIQKIAPTEEDARNMFCDYIARVEKDQQR